MYLENWPLALERFLIMVGLSIQNLMANQHLAPYLGLSNAKLAVVSFFHAITKSDFCHQYITRSIVCWDTLFPKRKQEVPQGQCHINRISMTVYFRLMFISRVIILFIAFFISDVQYKTLICYCYFIRMLTTQLIFDLIWHNTVRCFVFC